MCHPAHPLLGHREQVTLSDLNGEKLIAFEPDIPTRKVIDRHLREENVQLEHSMEFDNIEMVKRAVEIESGVSIVPSNTVKQEVQSGLLHAAPITPRMVRPLGMISRRSRPRSPAHKAFVQALTAYYRPSGGDSAQNLSVVREDAPAVEEELLAPVI